MVASADENGSEHAVITKDVAFERTILEQTVIEKGRTNTDEPEERHLKFALLACEGSSPYGPEEHTASIFLKVICRALSSRIKDTNKVWKVSIVVYRAQNMDFPKTDEEWDMYSGILLPGSFSTAYDDEEWIRKLRHIVSTEVYGKQRKALGICFGHQIFAHSFRDGLATKCPAGHQFGHRTISLNKEGLNLFAKDDLTEDSLDLLFTHGDMVQSLPSCAVCLGSTEHVPVQAAAYFKTDEDAQFFRNSLKAETDFRSENNNRPSPIAITFQAHPEYSDMDLGLKHTFEGILKKVLEHGKIMSQEDFNEAQKEVQGNFAKIEHDSISVVVSVGELLGWWDKGDI